MRRRAFVSGLVSASLAWPLSVHAQRNSRPVIGYFSFGEKDLQHPFLVAFHAGLKEGGYVEGQSVTIEYQWGEGRYDRLPALAEELVKKRPDVIVAAGDVPLRAVARATSTIPVVFITGADPVQNGLVASLARPGGNLTGITAIATELISKRFELLLELHPRSGPVALLVNPSGSAGSVEESVQLAEAVARVKGIRLLVFKASDDATLEAAFAAMKDEQAAALVVSADAFFFTRRERIAELAIRQVLPSIFELKEYVSSGGLLSYGPNLLSLRRQLGIYTGKVLNGARPSELPIQQPTHFELIINLKIAKAMSIDIPTGLLLRANELIE